MLNSSLDPVQYGYPTCFDPGSGIYDVTYAELWECDTTIWQPMVAGSEAQLTCSKDCQGGLSKVRGEGWVENMDESW